MPDVLKIGIAGLGTVGSETFRILTERGEFLSSRSGKKIEVTAVSAKNKKKWNGV
jgi:homoserine dehydrogenase